MGAAMTAKTLPNEFSVDTRGRNPNFENCPHGESVRFVSGGGADTFTYLIKNG
jgi:hypothetical protein